MIILVGVLFIFLATQNDGNRGELTTTTQASQMIEDGQISKVWAQGAEIRLLKTDSEIKAEEFPASADFYFVINYSEELDLIFEAIKTANTTEQVVEFTSDEVVDYWAYITPILYIGGGILLIVLFYKMMNRSNNSAMTFGKSKARQTQNIKDRFSDIAGADEEKAELVEIVEFLKNPQKFTNLGARIPKGILLVGNPGTGKTLLARAVAGESKVPFLSISGSDFVEMFVGVGASRVRDLFEQAKKSAPCIVFIDEIDAVGRQRGAGLGGGNDEREQTLNQLLVEMDGFEANEGIIVLAATNRSDVLDPALMRPGRFDRQIYVHLPDVKGREGILKIHARKKPIDSEVDFKTLARITSGFSGADLENMLNEAAILAARAGRAKIIMTDITEGINKVMMGPQKKSLVITEKDKLITAYHESGHAVLGKKLKNCENVQEVSIIPRGMAAGYTMSRPDSDDNHMTYGKLNDEIAMIMGGRIAEQIFMDDISTGASNDIQKATKIAKKMVTEWGMSEKFGFMNLGQSEEIFIGRDYQTKNNYSETTAAEIDQEIQKILNNNYKRAKKIIEENKDVLTTMAQVLLARETIYQEEVDLIMQGKTVDEVLEVIDNKIAIQKEKDQEVRKEQEIIQKLADLELKVRRAEAYYRSGEISKQDFDKLLQAREKMLQEIEALSKAQAKPEQNDQGVSNQEAQATDASTQSSQDSQENNLQNKENNNEEEEN
ncbi:MAG: ATP-dependent zinc metalloprotease FtsH [Clostridiales bacterium]|nr:ATP-dependent zinc metalloprotease FtsH [Clostridiales bacterium]